MTAEDSTATPSVDSLIEDNQNRTLWLCAQCGKESGMFGHGGRCRAVGGTE